VAAAESSAATSSDGGGVAIVGLGARGCAVVDRLVSRGALRRAQFWSLSADPNALQTALSPNRWRLPPGTVDPKDSAVEENAESVARGILSGGVANEPPAVVVVVASASEMVGSPLVTIDAVARLKDGPSQRGWFNVGGSQGITHRGPVFIVAAMTPFAFEGPRKSTDAIEALLAAQKRADAVAVVPQEALTGGVAQNGDPLTVAEVTELADATVQWSAWTILEMFASPAWVGLDGAASESTPGSKSRNRAWRYEPTLSPDVFRNLVAGRPKNAKLGCGACVVGYGTSTLELNFAPDEGQSAAIRVAAAAAAESSPFLRKRVFANAEFACVSVQTQATLTEAAVRAASDALASLVGVDVPQIVTAAKPDPRAPPDQVLVTILVAAQPEDAAARDVSRGGGEGKKTLSLLGMSFPSIPGMSMSLRAPSASPSVESVGRAKRLERELREEKAREEAEKARPAQKLTGDMLRKLGLGDPARPVEDGGDETSGAADAAENDAKTKVSEKASDATDAGAAENTKTPTNATETPPPLPMPPRRETKPVAPNTPPPMPAPEDVAAAVAPPEARAEAGAKPSETAPKVRSQDVQEDVEGEENAILEGTLTTPSAAESHEDEDEAQSPEDRRLDEAASLADAPDAAAPDVSPATVPAPAPAPEDGDEAFAVVVPLPPGIDASPVAVRILELEEDPTGAVIGYRPVSPNAADDSGDLSDFDDDDFGDLADRKPRRGLFGLGRRSASDREEDRGSKDAVKNRLASVLDRDRAGSILRTVRLEYAGSRVYEGEWFGNKPEGAGKQVFDNGDTYEGRWRDGLPDGRGVLTYARGGSFSGMFLEGKPNGPGVLDMRAAGGSEVEGKWVDGVLQERFAREEQ
jgi:cell division GTPase FtsZ